MSGHEASEPRRYDIGLEPRWVYERMWMGASQTVRHLNEAFKRPVRHNDRIERAALWCSLMLDKECARALRVSHREYLGPGGVGAVTRYELEGAIHVVHASLAFEDAEREMLRATNMLGDYEFASDDLWHREPALLDRWHGWLWLDGTHGRNAITDDHGSASVLAEGCNRLARVLPAIISSVAHDQ